MARHFGHARAVNIQTREFAANLQQIANSVLE